jgi:hypothetical protein
VRLSGHGGSVGSGEMAGVVPVAGVVISEGLSASCCYT